MAPVSQEKQQHGPYPSQGVNNASMLPSLPKGHNNAYRMPTSPGHHKFGRNSTVLAARLLPYLDVHGFPARQDPALQPNTSAAPRPRAVPFYPPGLGFPSSRNTMVTDPVREPAPFYPPGLAFPSTRNAVTTDPVHESEDASRSVRNRWQADDLQRAEAYKEHVLFPAINNPIAAQDQDAARRYYRTQLNYNGGEPQPPIQVFHNALSQAPLPELDDSEDFLLSPADNDSPEAGSSDRTAETNIRSILHNQAYINRQLQHQELIDCDISDCTVDNSCKLINCSIATSMIRNCEIYGGTVYESSITDCQIERCDAPYGKRTTIRDSEIERSNVRNAVLIRTWVERSEVTGFVEAERSKLSECLMHGSFELKACWPHWLGEANWMVQAVVQTTMRIHKHRSALPGPGVDSDDSPFCCRDGHVF